MKEFLKEHKEGVRTIGVVLGIIIVLVVLFVLSENVGDRSKDKLDTNTETTEEEVNPLLEDGQVLDEEKMKAVEEIDMDDFKSYLKKKKTTTVVMLGYESCYWCQQQKPILESLLYEKDLSVKYLDVQSLTSDEYEYLTGLHDDLAGFGTPTFISVRNKKVTNVSPDAKTRTELVKMFIDMGIIEEDK